MLASRSVTPTWTWNRFIVPPARLGAATFDRSACHRESPATLVASTFPVLWKYYRMSSCEARPDRAGGRPVRRARERLTGTTPLADVRKCNDGGSPAGHAGTRRVDV